MNGINPVKLHEATQIVFGRCAVPWKEDDEEGEVKTADTSVSASIVHHHIRLNIENLIIIQFISQDIHRYPVKKINHE